MSQGRGLDEDLLSRGEMSYDAFKMMMTLLKTAAHEERRGVERR